jgi:hypothetical protein
MDNSDNPDNLRLSPENIELLSEIGLLLRDDLGIVVSMLLAYGSCPFVLFLLRGETYDTRSVARVLTVTSYFNRRLLCYMRACTLLHPEPAQKVPQNLVSPLRTPHHIHRHISLCRRPDVYRLFAPAEGADRPI